MKRGPKLITYYIWITFIWACLIESTRVNCQASPQPGYELPPKLIDTLFKLPAPIPKWPSGTEFASGIIDIGDLQVLQISTFNKVWTTYEGGDENIGASFFEPTSIPEGFHMLGSYCQPNSQPLYGWVLVAKDDSSPTEPPALVPPTDYVLIWTSESKDITQDTAGYIWIPVAPPEYTNLGFVVTNSSQKPPVDKVRVVRTVLTKSIEIDHWIWGSSWLNVYNTRPADRGENSFCVPVGTFLATNDTLSLSCLANSNQSSASMPNLDQIKALIQAYAPVVYFHPDEKYFPSSVNWFFQNGATLYGQNSSPITIAPDGQNLPQGGSNDYAYWIDLPSDPTAAENVKKGNLQSATAYMHIKPVGGGTFTDIAVWRFYPYKGPGNAGIGAITISLSPANQHVSNWEHVTLRISNFNGELRSVYFSEHNNNGTWLSSSLLEFESNNKPIVYSARYGHGSYHKAGAFIYTPSQEKDAFGVRSDTSKSEFKMDTGANFLILDSELLGHDLYIAQPPWLNYAREWGPKKNFSIELFLETVEKLVPGPLQKKFDDFVSSLPPEELGEEGPVGPKWKDSWAGDERD